MSSRGLSRKTGRVGSSGSLLCGDITLYRHETITGLVHLKTTLLGELDLIEVDFQRTAALLIGHGHMRLLILNLELVIAMFGLIVVKVDICRFRLGGHSLFVFNTRK